MVTLSSAGPSHVFYETAVYWKLVRITQYQKCFYNTYTCLKFTEKKIIRKEYLHGSIYQVIKIRYKRPGDDSVTIATKLEMFFNASCYAVSVCKVLSSLSE